MALILTARSGQRGFCGVRSEGACRVVAANEPPTFCAAADRNKAPILEVLRHLFIGAGCVLEIGTGTRQYAAYFAANRPPITWQATELLAELGGIEAWRREAVLAKPSVALGPGCAS